MSICESSTKNGFFNICAKLNCRIISVLSLYYIKRNGDRTISFSISFFVQYKLQNNI